MNLSRYFHTIRHLRPIQVYGRLRRYAYQPALDRAPAPPRRAAIGRWIDGPQRRIRMLGPRKFDFLNEQRELHWPAGWSDPAIHTLWMFNLHYFDDLVAERSTERADRHRELIVQWIRDNGQTAEGPAWEPYVVAVRTTNWIKWHLAGGELSDEALASLAQQVRYLQQRVEWHLLGNHVLIDAKALIFAGVFFQSEEAQRWLREGVRILAKQLPEQILADGGHYELSPMYHSLVLEDLLDLLNMLQTYPAALPEQFADAPRLWRATAERMMPWLAAMTFPDGEIALFNDAAWGIAPRPAELFAYAGRLGLNVPGNSGSRLTHLAASGYVRIDSDRAVAILDVGEIGPRCQPGHGHADVLSFELAVDAERVVVNSGTSVYQGSPAERHRQRQTAAHSTVVVDGADSSEVWDVFRVARRAYPVELEIEDSPQGIRVACSHTGYRRLPGRVTHRRVWQMDEQQLTIDDRLTGTFRQAEARFHLHPAVLLEQTQAGEWHWQKGTSAGVYRGQALSIGVQAGTFHPEFGLSIPNQAIVASVGPQSSHEFRW